MKKVLLVVLTTAAVGLVATPGASAAPINGATIGKSCAAMNAVTQVQHWRWGSGGRWRGGCRRCNRWRCWWVC